MKPNLAVPTQLLLNGNRVDLGKKRLGSSTFCTCTHKVGKDRDCCCWEGCTVVSVCTFPTSAAAAACLFPCGAGTNKTGEDSDLHVPFSPTYCLGQLQAPFQEKPLLLEPEFNHVTKARGVLKLSTPAAAGK